MAISVAILGSWQLKIMETKLRVSTKARAQKSSRDEEVMAVSPTTEVFLNESVTVFTLCVFESELPVDASRIYDFINNDLLHVHPRLSSIAVEDKRGNKRWKRVEVNAEDHVKIPVFEEGLSAEDYSKHFDEYISILATSQMARDKPLWEAHLFTYPTKNNSGTIIFKFHHATADGISLMSIVYSCLKRVDDPTIPLSFPNNSSKNIAISSRDDEKPNDHNLFQSVINGFKVVPNFVASVYNSFCDFGQGVWLLYSEDDRTPIRSGNAKLRHPHYKICKATFSLNDVKTIKNVLGVTVNDVVVGMLILGVRSYMRELHHGAIKKTRSTSFITVNIRKDKGYALPQEMRKDDTKVPWGNKISGIDIPITNLDDDDFTNPLKFIMEAHGVIKRKRNTPLAQILLGCFMGVVRTCGGVQAVADIFERRTKNSSLFLTNVIGPIEKMSLGGHPIKGFYFLPTGIKSGLTVSVMSYMQMLTIGFAIEKGFIDERVLIKCMEKAFQLIFQAATTTSNSVTH